MSLLARPGRSVQLLAVAIATAAAWFSLARFDEGRQAYLDACRSLEQSTALAEQIAILRRKPDRAAVESRSEQSLAEMIEKSATTFGVLAEQIARIEPQQPRRVADSAYLEYATLVQIDRVTLAQLAATLAVLRGDSVRPEALRVSALRVSAPYQAAEAGGIEPWNAEFTLTYLVYSPKTAAPRTL